MDVNNTTKLEEAVCRIAPRAAAQDNDGAEAACAFFDSMAVDEPLDEACDTEVAEAEGEDPLLALMENWSGISSSVKAADGPADEMADGEARLRITGQGIRAEGIPVGEDAIATRETGGQILDELPMNEADPEIPLMRNTAEQAGAQTIKAESPDLVRSANDPGAVIAQLSDGVLIQREGRVEFVASPLPARVILHDPGAIVRQITDTLVIQRDGQIEVALSPEELGRVRLVMSGREHGLHVLIIAERPEVLDMLRRNSPALLEQFTDVGIGDASLEFRQDDGNTADDHESTGQSHGLADQAANASLPLKTISSWTAASGRLDLRF